jgi:hypothetical protein
MEYRLTKSKLQAFAQCPKQLWLIANPPPAELINRDEASELVMERGSQFGRAVQDCFPGGIEITAKEPTEAITETQGRLAEFAQGKTHVPLFEAAFGVDDVLVRVDVLEPLSDGSWGLIEVKSSVLKEGDEPKPHYVRDAATQAWVLRHAGLNLSRVELAQPDGDFRLPADGNLDGILKRIDITADAALLTSELADSIKAAAQVLDCAGQPTRQIGGHCTSPHPCAFTRYCSGAYQHEGETFQMPVWHLAGQPTAKAVTELMRQGHRDLAKVPEDRLDKPMHKIMRRVALSGEPYIDEKLREHLRRQPFPRYFLDYETNNSPLPLWHGTGPGERVAFQFSLHKWRAEDDEPEHFAFIGDSFSDPRPELAERLAAAMEEDGPVYAWNGASTEAPITLDLARYCSSRKQALGRVAESCRQNDPVKWFREWFYHPALNGSWGLKAVARAVLPRSPYEELEVANGIFAMKRYEEFLRMPHGRAKDELCQKLLDYCNTDTKIMIDIWRLISQ